MLVLDGALVKEELVLGTAVEVDRELVLSGTLVGEVLVACALDDVEAD